MMLPPSLSLQQGGVSLLHIQVISVGGLKEPFYQAACIEYQKRLSSDCKLKLTELPEERLPESPSALQIEQALGKEAERVRRLLPKQTTLIALCIEGKFLSSEALSATLDEWMTGGRSRLTFLIGGSFGLHPSLEQEAQLRLSMSKMTFPHHLARVMLLEQLYRAFQIRKASPYHK